MSGTSTEREAEMVRLYFAEHWKVGTIAAQLGVHPDHVRRVVGLEPERGSLLASRPKVLDPYGPFITEVLERYPTLRSTRLYDMLVERGYRGSARTVRRHVAEVRPRRRREVFLHTEPMMGEQSQVDWAYVTKLPVPGGWRAVWLFVLVLSYSRALWAEFVFDLSVHSLCRSLVRAARAFGGVSRQWLFDNPKTVVLERVGAAVRFHPVLLELCSALRVQPRLCAVARPQHKGRVERAIRYLRDRFLAGRSIASIADGNRQLERFIAEIAQPRPHPVLSGRTVGEVLMEEQARLLCLPDPLPTTDQVLGVHADTQAFVRFDTNRYSVDTDYAERALTLVADDQTIRLLDGPNEVARHVRCFGRRQVLEQPAHRAELVRQRRTAADLKGRDRLRSVVPDFDALLERWAAQGRSLAIQVSGAIRLLDLYGNEILAAAVAELATHGLSDLGALGVACDRLRRSRQRPVPIEVHLPAHVVDRDVVPHDLEAYDEPF